MPIMAPLADLVGVSRQVAVLAFQFGDGLSNIIWPTAMAPIMCGIAGVKIEKWWKLVVPIFLALLVWYFSICQKGYPWFCTRPWTAFSYF